MTVSKIFITLGLITLLLTGCGRAGLPLATSQPQNHKFILDPLIN